MVDRENSSFSMSRCSFREEPNPKPAEGFGTRLFRVACEDALSSRREILPHGLNERDLIDLFQCRHSQPNFIESGFA